MNEPIRITGDGEVVLPRNYAYWQNINAHRNLDSMLVFVGTSDGPYLYEVNKSTLNVLSRGKMFDEGPLANSTAEGWYWSAFDPYRIYCPTDDCLQYYNIATKESTIVVDIENFVDEDGLDGEEYVMRQCHSSFDETVHSCNVLVKVDDGAYPKVGSLVCRSDPFNWQQKWCPALGVLDECQIDKSGRWLLIKEDNNHRVVNLLTDEETFLSDAAGAVGHSDNGFGYAVGADNWQQNAAWRFHNFARKTSHIIYETSWEEQILHVSHCNAAVDGKMWVLGSGTAPNLMKVYLDGVTPAVPVCATMCVGDDYDNLPKASLDPYGQFAFWIRGGTRFDAFVVKVP